MAATNLGGASSMAAPHTTYPWFKTILLQVGFRNCREKEKLQVILRPWSKNRMAGVHATMKELHKASKHRFFNRKWNGRMGILENLDRIRFLWLRTMEYGRQVSDIEAALKVVDSVPQDLYYTVAEIYN
ncbi:uncharacterized protein LOC130993215 [Salvia miltiorrhiza]|uniref:uncharacterized protein LOC130993215 n=1 Tax=Salvia miltiorrhiza TaxID=226208 RepID=UPI0025ABE4A4|nr:uncharacterized protein LOC130993215 [Salvia miltiorrhiza]